MTPPDSTWTPAPPPLFDEFHERRTRAQRACHLVRAVRRPLSWLRKRANA